MDQEVDYNTIAAELIQRNAENVYDALVRFGSKISAKIKLGLKTAFKGYLDESIEKCSTMKTILYRDQAVDLYELYIPLDLENQNSKVEAADATKLFAEGQCFVITGTAGSGKSTLFKHLFLDTIRSGVKVPIFIELRALNNTEKTIAEELYERLERFGFALGKEHLGACLTSGAFAIFLDGFDELQLGIRDKVAKEIGFLADKYPENYYIVSSRPDDRFISWQRFLIFKTLALDEGKACELVKRLDYDNETKDRFIADLSSRLYKQHVQFLSNPLLLTIMLLCYREYADIPNKRSLFYAQAFEALFCKHDATKGGYRREMHVKLAMDDFGRVLSCFCILTHSKGQVALDRTMALEHLNEVRRITGLAFDKEDYLRDLLESVCILIPDGIHLSFTHRSFQEYFAAKYIALARESVRKKLIAREFKGYESNEMLGLLWEIDPDLVESEVVIPRLRRILREINYSKRAPVRNYCSVNRLICKELQIEKAEKGYRRTWSDTSEVTKFLGFLADRYPSYSVSKFHRYPQLVKRFLKRYGDDEEKFSIKIKDFAKSPSVVRELMKVIPVLHFTADELSCMLASLEENQRNQLESIKEILLAD